MGRFKLGKLKQQETKSWKDTLIDRVHQGKVLPILGGRITSDMVFGSYDDVVAAWADYIEFKQNVVPSLPQMAQYQSVMFKADGQIKADDVYIKEVYLDFLQRLLATMADEDLLEELEYDPNVESMSFSEIAERLELNGLATGQENPLLLLAELPLSIYVTTCTSTFLEMALRRAGKTPRTEICYWDLRLRSIPSVMDDLQYRPTAEEPLVYHLHGLDKYPNSLVLTEDDYLDFLSNISNDWDGIPLPIRQALADSSVMLMGYKLQEWDFRVVFRGLIKASIEQRRVKSVAIQIGEDDEQRNYLENYLRQQGDFEVYWGETQQFINEIWQGWKG